MGVERRDKELEKVYVCASVCVSVRERETRRFGVNHDIIEEEKVTLLHMDTRARVRNLF